MSPALLLLFMLFFLYRLFDLVSWNEILFGADIANIRHLALFHFDLEYIESSFVMFIFQFGLFGAIIFLLFLVRTYWVLLSGAGRHVIIGTLAFFIPCRARSFSPIMRVTSGGGPMNLIFDARHTSAKLAFSLSRP